MSINLKAAFVGCSMTLGEGFEPEDRAGNIYPDLVAKQFMLDHTNLSRSGASNHMIFITASKAIRSGKYDLVFCQWSGLNRLWLSPAPDAWYYVTGHGREDYRSRELIIDIKAQNQLADLVLLLNHDYLNIIYLCDYINTLDALAKANSIKLIHINGMLPWQSDLMDPSSNLSNYTREILDVDTRDDDEIRKLFQTLQQQFATIDQTAWVNLFESFQSITHDQGPQGHHPGPKSHHAMAKQIYNYLQGTL